MAKKQIRKLVVKSPNPVKKSVIKKTKRNSVRNSRKQVKSKKKNLDGDAVKPDLQEKPQKNENLKGKRDAKGRMLPGSTANPNGRPRVNQSRSESLTAALTRYEMGIKPDPKNIWDKFVYDAFRDKTVLINLMKKLLPDLKSIQQVNLDGGGLTKEEAKLIQEEMAKRFK